MRATWADAVAHPADAADQLDALGVHTEIWRVPAELLVYRTREDAVRWREGPDDAGEETMVHVIFDPEAVTIVVGERGATLACEIRDALINNGMISIAEVAA